MSIPPRGPTRTIKYRCSPKSNGGCAQRFTMPKPPAEYQLRPRTWNEKQWQALLDGTCPFCYNARYYNVTRSVRRWTEKSKCNCGGYLHHPHSRGSNGCIYAVDDNPWGHEPEEQQS